MSEKARREWETREEVDRYFGYNRCRVIEQDDGCGVTCTMGVKDRDGDYVEWSDVKPLLEELLALRREKEARTDA